jgi:hypothetical protein
VHIAIGTRQSIFALFTVTGLAGLPANAADPPADMRAISGVNSGRDRDKERPRVEHRDVRAL